MTPRNDTIVLKPLATVHVSGFIFRIEFKYFGVSSLCGEEKGSPTFSAFTFCGLALGTYTSRRLTHRVNILYL